MGKVAALSNAEIEDLLFRLRAECAAIDRAIAQAEAPQPRQERSPDRMEVSPNTIEAFLHAIMLRMGATTPAGAVDKVLGKRTGAMLHPWRPRSASACRRKRHLPASHPI